MNQAGMRVELNMQQQQKYVVTLSAKKQGRVEIQIHRSYPGVSKGGASYNLESRACQVYSIRSRD